MAYKGNKFLFNQIAPDSSVLPEENPQPLTAEKQMELLGERLQEYSEGWNPDYKLSYEKTQENGKDGYNIHLPYGVDFRIEHGNITFSKFGLSKDELKNVYAYLSQLGISGLGFDSNERDAAFEQNAKDAQQELRNEDGMFELFMVEGAEQPLPVLRPANNNEPQIAMPDSIGMSEEEALQARRNMAKALRNNVRPQNKAESKPEEHPCLGDIERYISNHVKATQKNKSDNYRKIAIGNGYKLMWYKDADQKYEGPKADKNGKVAPNFDAGLRAQITRKDGKPYLNVSVLTPKYGDVPDWVMDEAVGLAAECKSTHVRFKAAAAFKGKFLNSCAKKMIVPTGVKLKEKEFNAMMKLVKENNDDPAKRAEFYKRFAEQLEDDLVNMWQKDQNANNPYVKMIKTLKIQIAVESSEEKYKRFNNFYEKNVLGKMYTDKSDTPVDLFEVKDPKDGTNAAKELASGMAYVEFMAQYINDDKMQSLTDEQMQAKYIEFYNKNLYLAHKNLRRSLRNASSSKDVKEILNREYQKVQKNIAAVRSKVAYEGFDKLMTPQMDKFTYYNIEDSERNMANRLRAGRELALKDSAYNPVPVYSGGRE